MKKKIVTGIHLELEIPYANYLGRELKLLSAHYEREAKDLQEFIRDHRSCDQYTIHVVKETETICEFCNDEWETLDSGEPVCCTKAQEEWNEEQERIVNKIKEGK